jgi:hypothetical protein
MPYKCPSWGINETQMGVNSSQAEKIVEEILSTYEEILGISIMDMRGNILAANSKEAFREAFAVSQDRAKYGGALSVALLDLANSIRTIFGAAKAIIAIHENCKLMLLSVPSFQLLVGLVLQYSVNAEDHQITSRIEILLADTLNDSTINS